MVKPLVCKSTFKSYWCSAQYRALLSMEKGYEKAVFEEPYSDDRRVFTRHKMMFAHNSRKHEFDMKPNIMIQKLEG